MRRIKRRCPSRPRRPRARGLLSHRFRTKSPSARQTFNPELELESEGYEPAPGGLSSFERKIDTQGVQVGASQFASVQSNVYLYASDTVGSSLFAATREALLGSAASNAVQPEIRSLGLSEIDNLVSEEVEIGAIGDESWTVLVRYDSELGAFEHFFVGVRVGEIVTLLLTTAPEGDSEIVDIEPLAQLVAERSESQLAASGN